MQALALRTAVVLNLAGPYTQKAPNLIAACIEAGTSYVDLSGEIPLLRRVIDRFDEPAKRAGVQVVQMAGWEAMPADLTTLIACRRAAGDEAGPSARRWRHCTSTPSRCAESRLAFSQLPSDFLLTQPVAVSAAK